MEGPANNFKTKPFTHTHKTLKNFVQLHELFQIGIVAFDGAAFDLRVIEILQNWLTAKSGWYYIIFWDGMKYP